MDESYHTPKCVAEPISALIGNYCGDTQILGIPSRTHPIDTRSDFWYDESGHLLTGR